MKLLFTYFLVTSTLSAFAQLAQNDSILKVNADKYLLSIYGKKFVENNLKFSEVIGAGVIAVFYETNCGLRGDGRNTIMLYSIYESNEVDTTRKIFTKKEILRSMNRKKSSNLFIGKAKAREIAKSKGLIENEYPWKISAYNFGAHQEPKWGVTSTKYESSNGHGSGEALEINMVNGATDLLMWSAIP